MAARKGIGALLLDDMGEDDELDEGDDDVMSRLDAIEARLDALEGMSDTDE